MAAKESGRDELSFLSRLKSELTKSRANLQGQLKSIFTRHSSFDESIWEELEEVLVRADVGIKTTNILTSKLRKLVESNQLSAPHALYPALKGELVDILIEGGSENPSPIASGLIVYLIVGVNGTGKTTTIAKLAHLAKQEDKKVLLAAADTFRAAAIEQLEEWGKRIDVEVIKHQRGADASAVVYDALQAAKSRGIDVLIIDTAGRLHTYGNLMEELKKIKRIASREAEDAKVLTLLIIDATTGQNAISQAVMFNEVIGVDGIILTKLDGTAKGGIVIAIKSELGLPIHYVGLGEKLDDLQVFDASDFVEALLSTG